MERTVILTSPASFSRSAASTACSSYPLITGGMPGAGTSLLVAGSILKLAIGIWGSGTCFTQTMIFIEVFLRALIGAERGSKRSV